MDAAALATAAQQPPPPPPPLHRRRTQPVCAQRRGQPGRLAPVIAVGRKSVDFARIQTRILARGQDCLEGELEFGVGRSPMTVILGFANPNDSHATPERAARPRPAHYDFTFAGARGRASSPNAPASARFVKRLSS